MRRHLLHLRFLVAALLVAVMVIVPIAEAAACAVEVVSTHSHSDGTNDAGPTAPDEDGGGTHAGCVHNHCHHVLAGVSAPLQQMFAFARAPALARADVHHPSRSPDQLTRPPRV